MSDTTPCEFCGHRYLHPCDAVTKENCGNWDFVQHPENYAPRPKLAAPVPPPPPPSSAPGTPAGDLLRQIQLAKFNQMMKGGTP